MPATLRRELTLLSASALVVSNMIGTGIFTTTGFLAGDLGQPILVLGIWVVGALMVTAGCLSYAELGINFPRSGGEYVYLREAWGPAWGFMSGWVSFLAGFAAPVALGALAFSEYLSHFFPALRVSQPAGSAALGWLHLGPRAGTGAGRPGALHRDQYPGTVIAARLQSAITILESRVCLPLSWCWPLPSGTVGGPTSSSPPHALLPTVSVPSLPPRWFSSCSRTAAGMPPATSPRK